MTRFLVAYDVSDDGDRGRLAALLSRYGVRVQWSVFDCELEHADVADLLSRAEVMLTAGTDRVGIYPQCEACRAGRRHHGPPDDILDQPYYVV